MKCNKCGTELTDDAAFCYNCGNQVGPVQPVQGSAPVRVTTPHAEPRIRKQFLKPLGIKDCPVIFKNCMIVDRPDGSGEVDFSAEISNMSAKEIEAIYFELKGLDVLNEEKCNIKDICFLDMCIKQGTQQLLPEAIKLPDKTIRRIRMIIRHVCFTDESIWSYDGNEPLSWIDDDETTKTEMAVRSEPASVNEPEKTDEVKITESSSEDAASEENIRVKEADTEIMKEETKESAGDLKEITAETENADAKEETSGSDINTSSPDFSEIDATIMLPRNRSAISGPFFDNKELSDNRVTEKKEEKKEKLTCKYCGTELNDDDMFCFNCGKKI